MQALKAGWVGQTFALARRDDSGEKKPRRRRTKEERRAMVESFIKKYRTTNSGKFPSLNLTHKEVGGSFYIVREIVRDIIQENKVLGPGDASLKALNLEAGLEEHASGSTDPDVYLSISSMTHVADHEGMEMSSMANEHQSKESYDLVKSDDQDIYASHANDVSVAEVWHDKSSDHLQYSNGPSPYDILLNAQSKEENLQKPSGSMHDNTGIHEQNDPVPQGSLENCGVHKIEQSYPFNQSVSITSPTKGLMLDEKDVEKKSRGVAEATDISAESNVIPTLTGTDVLPEATISDDLVNSDVSDQLVDQLVSGAKDIFPTATSSTNSCDLDLSPLETKELINSQEVLGMQKSEVEVPFMPGNKVPNINSTKSTGANTFSSVNKEETVMTSMISQTLVSPASGTSSTETVIIIGGDGGEKTLALARAASEANKRGERGNGEASERGQQEGCIKPNLNRIKSPFCLVNRPALPVVQPNDMENMAMKTESASSESLSPSAKEISDSDCSTKHENIASDTDRGSNRSSKSSGKADKELETAEVNPVWATIKAFIDAVIKFWTE